MWTQAEVVGQWNPWILNNSHCDLNSPVGFSVCAFFITPLMRQFDEGQEVSSFTQTHTHAFI